MPNISEKALSAMIEEASGEDIIIPRTDFMNINTKEDIYCVQRLGL